MRKILLVALVALMAVPGCGNPDGLTDVEYTAKLRNEREDRDRSRQREQAAYELQIAVEQARQRKP